jgi:RNA polymerase sigma-70 factor, ECF subfamily
VTRLRPRSPIPIWPVPDFGHNLGSSSRVLVASIENEAALEEARIREFLAGDYARLVAGLSFLAGSYANAEEAVQEALARAWERSERGEHIQSLTGWVAVVATNRVRSSVRRFLVDRRARRRMEPGVEDHVLRQPDEADERVDVERAIAQLTRRQREVVVLFYFADRSVREIADALSTTEGAIKSALHRARESIARSLAQEPQPEEADDARR